MLCAIDHLKERDLFSSKLGLELLELKYTDERIELEEEVNPRLDPVQEGELEQEEISSSGSAIMTHSIY